MSMPAIDIDKLEPEERLRLIGDLWESLRKRPGSVRLTEGQRAELDRRLDELDRGQAEVVSWDEAKRRLRSSSE
jgi:putative addiction module component (TIGR02574 family)